MARSLGVEPMVQVVQVVQVWCVDYGSVPCMERVRR